jgi:hypothetical protein
MVNKEALDYILECLRQKIEPQAIRAHLKATGYSDPIVEEAFKEAEGTILASPAPHLAAPLEARLVADGLPGMSNLLSFAWRELFSRPRVYLGIQFLPIALGILLAVIDNPLKGVRGIQGLQQLSSSFSVSPALAVALTMLTLLGWLLNLLSPLALLTAYRDAVGVREAYRRALKNFYGYLWLIGLSGLIIGGSFLLFIIPGVLFSLWFSLALYVFVFENLKGARALHKSRAYVEGHTFEVFIRLFELGLLLGILAWIMNFFLGGSLYLSFMQNTLSSSQVTLTTILWSLPTLVTTPLWLLYVAGIYKKLAFLKAGAGADFPAGTRMYWIVPLLGLIVLFVVFIGGAALLARLFTH